MDTRRLAILGTKIIVRQAISSLAEGPPEGARQAPAPMRAGTAPGTQPSPPHRASTPLAPPGKGAAGTGCLPCGKDHWVTTAGALAEALRFARKEGIAHPEVQRRLALAEEEMDIGERIDFAPDALAQLSDKERELALWSLPRMRDTRHAISGVRSLEDLERAAREAAVTRQEYRLRMMQLQGVDLKPLVQVAQRFEKGELTREQARDQLQRLIPQ